MARLHVAPAAAMKLTFTINQARYRDALNTFVHELNADALVPLKEEMRLLLRDILFLTPPTKSPKKDEIKRSAKQRGDSAVEADLSQLKVHQSVFGIFFPNAFRTASGFF